MDESREEKYKKRIELINKKLEEPKLRKKIDKFLLNLTEVLDCDAEIIFNVYPEVDEYGMYMESDEFEIPKEYPTMKLKEFISHIKDEDMEFNVYIDPIYLRKGLNEVNDVLTTTIDNNMIIVPISDKKTNKEL